MPEYFMPYDAKSLVLNKFMRETWIVKNQESHFESLTYRKANYFDG